MISTRSPREADRARRRRLRADLTLLLVAVIWGSAFVVQRIAALQMGVFLFNGLRFLLAALVLLPFCILNRNARPHATAANRQGYLGILLAGLLLACGAGFQQTGLRYTTAGNAGFITGLYVIFVPLFLAALWKQALSRRVWLAALLAAGGLFLLSTGGQMRLNPGDLLELLCAVFWALHVILIGWLVQRIRLAELAMGQYLVCGVFSTLLGLTLERGALPSFERSWWIFAYTGIVSAGLGYTLQAAAQREAPPADTAVILSSEGVLAALSGWLFLGETLSTVQLLGCGIILAGVLLAQAHLFRR